MRPDVTEAIILEKELSAAKYISAVPVDLTYPYRSEIKILNILAYRIHYCAEGELTYLVWPIIHSASLYNNCISGSCD